MAGGGITLLTTACWPMVQKFVVIQYRIRPAGKLMMNGMKMNGSAIIKIYERYFHFPVLRFRLPMSVVLGTVAIAVASAVLGSLAASWAPRNWTSGKTHPRAKAARKVVASARHVNC